MVKQISLRLPDDLHERLKVTAERDRRSLHAEILFGLEAWLEQSEKPQKSE